MLYVQIAYLFIILGNAVRAYKLVLYSANPGEHFASVPAGAIHSVDSYHGHVWEIRGGGREIRWEVNRAEGAQQEYTMHDETR